MVKPTPIEDGGVPLLQAGTSLKPVFVHSGFRTSSTWLWSKLRSVPTALGFYEFFHEFMSIISVATVREATYDAWDSKHPPSAPYFLEFIPLLGEGGHGMPGFEPDMAIDRFIPPGGIDGDLGDAEVRYVERLIDHARAQGRVAVLADVRTLGRVAAFRRAFDALNVVLARNVFHQWASCSQQFFAGNEYFLNQIESMVAASRHDPTIALLDDVFRARKVDARDENLLQLFIMLHLYLYARTFDAADEFIDATELADNDGEAARLEGVLGRAVGHPINLRDARNSFQASLVAVSSRRQFIDTVEQLTKLVLASCPSSSEGRDRTINRMKDAALAEWERNEFYSRGVRSFLLQSRERSGRLAAEADASVAALTLERDAATHQAREASEAQRRSIAALEQDRDDLRSRLAEAQRVSEDHATEVAGLERALSDDADRITRLTADRDRLTLANHEIGLQRTSLATDVSELRAECYRLRRASKAEAAGAGADRNVRTS